MDTDDLTIVAETKRLNIDPLVQDDRAAEEEGPVETYDMPILHDAEGNMVSEMQSRSSSEDDDAVEESMVTLAPASSRHDSLAMHKSNLEISSQVDTASQEPPVDESIKPKSLVITDVVQVPPHTTSNDDGGKAIHSNLEALGGLRKQEDIEGPWQAELRDAADEQPSDVLSKALPSGYRDLSDQSIRNSPEITAGEVSVRASPLLAAPMSELLLENNVTLPPLPFPSEDDVRHETSQESPAKLSADEGDTIAATLNHRLSKPPTPSALELNTTVKGHTTALDVEYSTSVAVIPEEDRMEDVSFAHAQETAKDLGSITTVPEPKAQPTHPHKRLRASRRTTSISETDSDGPVKKKPMNNAASLAKARASKAASKKLSKAPKDQEDESTPPLVKSRRAAAKSRKEAAHVDITNEETSLSTKHARSDQRGDSADMEEHYSDVEKPATPSKQTPAGEIVLGTPMSRPSVSKHELQDLTTTLYRERPSKAKPISRKLFSPHKSNALGELMSSMPAPADSQTVPVSDTDTIGLFRDLGVPDTTTKALKRSAPKPRATPAKAARAKNGPTASGPTKKTPATRTTRKRMAAPKKEENTKSKEQEECEVSVVLTEPKIDTKGSSPEMDVPLPPRPLRITSRMSLLDDPVNEHAKLGSEKALLSDTSEPEGDDDVPQDIDDLENEDEDDDDADFEDAQDTVEASGDDDDSDNDTPPPSKKPKLKNKSLILGGHTIRQTRSRATTTPARSISSKAAAPAKNKFGFTHPLTRQAKKVANTSTAPAPAKPAPKASAKSKGKKATASVATVSPEPAKQPSVRKTRHASAMEEEDKVESKRNLRSGG
ncbi:hypothetical protein BKA58DRAFT_385165 [Alternaria rosae]|uniref:uncharacterized protein n=1 Tax=Alternaria rosae TaxID=1187941 RepID=UPI001E8E77D4|nr:uncharacterized protein BKA58DRAFT_385165 [Alternaria rosae]KAH6870492.1 hypothetical protein BKA58DRAFT_385165 [Alternaria rosae]